MKLLCKNCILPQNYAGISINEDGLCNLCEDFKPIKYLGEDKFKEDVKAILKKNKSSNYDCLVGLSGGRDSTYLLWYIVKVLKIKPLALFVDSGLIPVETLSNIRKTVDLLNVDLIKKTHEYLQKTVKHFLKSWQKYPHPATLITLCTGCRYGYLQLLRKEAVAHKVPIVFEGGTFFEEGTFKKDLISQNSESNLSFIAGYGKQILKNPALISNPACLKIQVDEFLTMPWSPIAKFKKHHYVHLMPFRNYFRWEQDKIEATIQKELNWKRYPGLESSYRGDCDVGIIRQYLYNFALGYNDKDDHLSWLIRDGQITREEALRRIEKEKNINADILKASFVKLGFDFEEYMKAVSRNAKKYKIEYYI